MKNLLTLNLHILEDYLILPFESQQIEYITIIHQTLSEFLKNITVNINNTDIVILTNIDTFFSLVPLMFALEKIDVLINVE